MEPVITSGNDCLVTLTIPIKDGMDILAVGTKLQKAFASYGEDVNVQFPYVNGASYAKLAVHKTIDNICTDLPKIVNLMDKTLSDDEVDKKAYRISYRGYIYKYDASLSNLSETAVQNMLDKIMINQVKSVVDVENEERNETLRTYVSYEKERMLKSMFVGIWNRKGGNNLYSFYSDSLVDSLEGKDIAPLFKATESVIMQGVWSPMDEQTVENIAKKGNYFVKHEKENFREWSSVSTRVIRNGENEFYQIGTGVLMDGKTSAMYVDGKMSLHNFVHTADTISFHLRNIGIDLPKTKILQDFMVNAKELKLEKTITENLGMDNIKEREHTRVH